MQDYYTRTLKPVVTGSSVLGIKYQDGVMLVCDTLASYGNSARYPKVKRIHEVGDHTIIAASGEYSDFQKISTILESKEAEDWADRDHDGYEMEPSEYASLLSRIYYNRRSKFNPLWNSVVVAGFKNEKPYLGYIDMYGTVYEDSHIATGFGRYFGMTLLREKHSPDMNENAAKKLLEDCMRIAFCRDCHASNRIQIATVTAAGVRVEEPTLLQGEWNVKGWTDPTVNMGLAGNTW